MTNEKTNSAFRSGRLSAFQGARRMIVIAEDQERADWERGYDSVPVSQRGTIARPVVGRHSSRSAEGKAALARMQAMLDDPELTVYGLDESKDS